MYCCIRLLHYNACDVTAVLVSYVDVNWLLGEEEEISDYDRAKRCSLLMQVLSTGIVFFAKLHVHHNLDKTYRIIVQCHADAAEPLRNQ